jgi:hypothetical protein
VFLKVAISDKVITLNSAISTGGWQYVCNFAQVKQKSIIMKKYYNKANLWGFLIKTLRHRWYCTEKIKIAFSIKLRIFINNVMNYETQIRHYLQLTLQSIVNFKLCCTDSNLDTCNLLLKYYYNFTAKILLLILGFCVSVYYINYIVEL